MVKKKRASSLCVILIPPNNFHTTKTYEIYENPPMPPIPLPQMCLGEMPNSVLNHHNSNLILMAGVLITESIEIEDTFTKTYIVQKLNFLTVITIR